MGVGSPKFEDLVKHRGIVVVFRLAEATVHNDQGEIWRGRV